MPELIQEILHSKNAIMFITAVVFMIGILSYFNDCEILAGAFVMLFAVILVIRNRISLKYVLLWVLVFYLGFFNASLRVKNTDALFNFAPIDGIISGRVVSIPNTANGRTKFFFDVSSVNGIDLKAKTYVTLDGSADFNIGDNLEINSKIRRPFKAGNPSQFDYGRYLRNFNAFTTSYVKPDGYKILNTDMPLKWKFMQTLNKVRTGVLESHAKYLQSPNLEILGGIVFGDDAVAPPDYIKTTFVNSGLLHILAASGMNVAFIFAFWFMIMKFFKVPYRINIIGGMIMVVLYTLMTGLGASVLRAALMLLFIQAGKLIDRDAHSVSLLSFVAVLLLLYNPAYINDVGFQLSFIVTFGLLTTANVIFEKTNEVKLADWIKGAVLIPIVAQIWVVPVQMFYFNTISTYSIFANILTVPFLSVISFGGFVSSILATIKPIADVVCMTFDFVLKYFLDVVVIISNTFASFPNSLITTTHPKILQLIIYYTLVMLLTLLIKIGLNKKILISSAILAVLICLLSVRIPNHNLEIIAFDVQNADALMIKTPENKYFIIDTAKMGYKSSSSVAKLVIEKYLKDRGIKEIEGLILTHFDLDHAGGASDLINDFKINHVYVNSLKRENYTVFHIFESLDEKGMHAELAKNDEVIYSEKGLTLKTFISGIKDNDNENSILTLLSYKDFDMLFTGDAGVVAFDKVKDKLPYNIEVLKVGHHGGRNVVNNEMLDRLNAKVSIISTGPNSFGHPNKGTLDLLRGTNIYRTDKNNSVKIETDGLNYKVLTFDKYKKRYKLKQEFTAQR